MPGFGVMRPLNSPSIWSLVGASPGGQAAKARRANESTLFVMRAFTSSKVKLTSSPLERQASFDSRSVPIPSRKVKEKRTDVHKNILKVFQSWKNSDLDQVLSDDIACVGDLFHQKLFFFVFLEPHTCMVT